MLMTDDPSKMLRSGKMFRLRNVVFLLGILLVIWIAQFAYRKNNICSSDEHILQSETDAIEVAKSWIVTDPFFHPVEFGSAMETLNSMNDTKNCCHASRTRNLAFVIEWNVSLVAERGAKRLIALMDLSNCGAIFSDRKFRTVEPR